MGGPRAEAGKHELPPRGALIRPWREREPANGADGRRSICDRQPQHRRWRLPVRSRTGPSRVNHAPVQKGADPNARVRENTLTRTIFTMQWFWEAGATAFVRAARRVTLAYEAAVEARRRSQKLPTDLGDSAVTASAARVVEGVTYKGLRRKTSKRYHAAGSRARSEPRQ